MIFIYYFYLNEKQEYNISKEMNHMTPLNDARILRQFIYRTQTFSIWTAEMVSLTSLLSRVRFICCKSLN